MGKKRVIQEKEEDLLRERDQIEKAAQAGIRVSIPQKKTKEGKVYISSSYNNTIMTLTNFNGDTLAWASAGSIGFKGAKKATPFAASKVSGVLAQAAEKMGISDVYIFVKGIGSGRESAIRSLAAKGLNILSIKDITPIPHNGCRPSKVRRV